VKDTKSHPSKIESELCFLQEGQSLESLFRSLGYSKQRIKKFLSTKSRNKLYRRGSVITVPLSFLNTGHIAPTYTGPSVEVLWQDQNLIVMDKPNQIHGHPLDYNDQSNLLSWSRSCGHGVEQTSLDQAERGLLYRLDFETSGVLIGVKNTELHRELRENYKEKVIDKVYLALVEGDLPARGKLVHCLSGSGEKGKKVIESSSGVAVSLDFERVEVETKEDTSLVLIKLGEGVRHQIRAQFSAIGHPLVGDTLYGANPSHRMYLHAFVYRMSHNNKAFEFCAKSLPLFSHFLNLDSAFKVLRNHLWVGNCL
jgi:23S rRNA-/tRNA-specific pseudouridylate synthase